MLRDIASWILAALDGAWMATLAYGAAHLWLLSCFFLVETAVLCLLGLVAPGYRENLLQNAGMGLLTIGCFSRVKDIWQHEAVSTDWFMVHAGLGMYALGQLVKMIVLLRKRRLRKEVLDTIGLDAMLELSRWRQSTAHVRDTGAPRR